MRRHRIYDATQGQKPLTPETALRLAQERKQQPDLTKSNRALIASAKSGAVRSQFRRRAK